MLPNMEAPKAGCHAPLPRCAHVEGFSLDGVVMRKNAFGMMRAMFRVLMPKKPPAFQKPST